MPLVGSSLPGVTVRWYSQQKRQWPGPRPVITRPALPITNMPGPGTTTRLPGHCSKLVGIKNAGPSPRNDPLTQAVVMVMIK